MRKILSIFAAMLVAVAVNATVIQITPTSPHSSDNLRQAVASAVTGDIIEMAAGTYEESTSDYIAFHGKEVVVRAAEGAEVIVKTAVPIRLKTGGRAEFDGIKFDCENLTGYSNLIVPADDEINKRVILNNCEFYNWTKNSALIQSTSSRRLDSIVINNCYFHNCEKSMVFVENANLVGLEIKNSTFANITATVTDSYYAAPIYVKATTGKVLVDHCTFYNVESMSLSYGVVSVDAIADATVSNCIFMLPATVDKCATNLKAGGDVKNTLTYNYDNWQPYGHFNTATLTDCVKADPLFVDAANGDYRLALNSPARKAGSDGKTLGDPRWWPMYQVSTHSIDFGDVEKGSGSAMESFYLKGADLTANVRIYDFTIPYGAVFSKYPAAVTPVEAEYTNGKKVEVYAAKYVDVAEYKGYLVLESPDFPNDTIWLRANIVEPAPAPEHTFTVAGDNVDVFGTSWDPTNTANDMVLQEDNTYKWEKTGLTLPMGQIAFKVVKDHDWNNGANAYPADNYIINITEAGIYTIAIYYNPNDNNYVGDVVTKTGDAVVIPSVAMHGNFLGSWA